MIEQTALSNGLTLLTEQMPNIRSVSIGVWLRKGSRHEIAAENGISHFLEHLVFKGTRTRTTAEIARIIDSIGGQMDAFTTKEYTCFYAKVLDEHLPVAVDLLSDILLHPRFDPGEIERERRVIFEEIRMVEDTPDELIYDLFSDYFWPSHPLGRPIQGTADTVRAMHRDRLRTYFEESYQPGRIIISAAGNLDHVDLTAAIRTTFEPLADRTNHLPEQAPAARAGLVVREKNDLEQLHVCLGLEGFPQNHPRRYEWHVLNTLLGGSMSSRLFQNIRENRGLAYSIYSSVNAFRDTGNLLVHSATSPDSGEEVIRLILEEFRNLKRTRVDPEELKMAKENLKGSLMLSLESSSSRMSNLARQHIYFGRQSSLNEIINGIEAVNEDMVIDLAREMLVEDRCALAVLGRVSSFRLTDEELSF
jgi:predicted Zn-dependent peptidase